jgi:rfaE bifunctional protein nucleotidyltransferase chain/domain
MKKKQSPIEKIIKRVSLKNNLLKFREEGLSIGLMHGTFDLLHSGHLLYFKEGASLADITVVTITSDQFIKKGPGRPLFCEEERAAQVASICWIDYVSVNDSSTAVNLLDEIRPDIYIKGPDYKNHDEDPTGMIRNEVEIVEGYGGKVHYTCGIKLSSSQIIKDFELGS